MNSNGSFTYTPNADFHGADTFTYQASDGNLTDTGHVTITVLSVNDVPVAHDDNYATQEDTPLNVPTIEGVLANDTDVDGDALSVELLSGGTATQNGTLTLSTDGSFTYIPNANFQGEVSFTYKAKDGAGESVPATVRLTIHAINDIPTADNQTVTTNEDTTKTITLTASDVDGDNLTYHIVDLPVHGTLSGSAPNLTYTPAQNYHGPDNFTFKVNDGTGDSNIANVSITVNPVNDVPVAHADNYSTDANTPLTIPTPGVLSNDTDVDNANLTAIKVADPAHGSLTLNSDGSFTYVPVASFHGTDTFTYKASDGAAESEAVTVTLTVNAANEAPVVDTVNVSTLDPQPVDSSISLSGTFTDVDTEDTHSAAWSFLNVNQLVLKTGTITESAGSGQVADTFTFNTAAGFNVPGVYQVTLQVIDNNGLSAEKTLDTYIVIYDPSAGFVTGGGWIYCRAGSSMQYPDAYGKANFGFVSRYQRGASQPSGNTEFQFKAGDLNFKSTSYEWLVVNTFRAQYKGEGTINGQGRYGFILTCIDGQVSNAAGGLDRFRIQIWDKNNADQLVFDNLLPEPVYPGPDADLKNYAATVIGGGSIVIHNK